MRFAGDTVKIISRDSDSKFKCFCSRSFLLPRSLCEHAKDCNWDSSSMTKLTIASVILRELSESSMMEGEERDEMIEGTVTADLPFDYIGEWIHENWLIVDDEICIHKNKKNKTTNFHSNTALQRSQVIQIPDTRNYWGTSSVFTRRLNSSKAQEDLISKTAT